MAPVDQRAQRLLSRERGAVSSGQQAEAVIQARRDPFDRYCTNARRGKLDRERNAVEVAADVGYRATVPRVELERRQHRTGAFGEQAHGRISRISGIGVGLVRLGYPERRYRVDDLTGDPQRLATRGQQLHPGRPTQQLLGQCGAGADQMFAIVEHEEQSLVGSPLQDDVDEGTARFLRDAQYLRDCVRHREMVRDRREFDEPHTVRVVVEHVGGKLQREPSLADAPCAHER